ncbi:putative RNA polymerase II subunit B1 CTD phosphatase RPAP2 homolog [Uloborus diversus]|uniref:putative RNA polymerase II subunit B1 CTD phosphatase RPAP2 homolog n=1 Tax=Uloborus diversus TaxID=327109 RepID=UPI00240A286A|nr:putative RNA polymerase II subunit B1 CTD phosphatase RPAP2 homolog [Uloborus diversus]
MDETEKTRKQMQIFAAREKILKIKKIVFKIIEEMLEKEISEDWFLENCPKLCTTEYEDVIVERSIDRLCGYPLCSNSIKQVKKQIYHICCLDNKVYDLTERKYFCSSECFKASNILKHQLSSLPLYMSCKSF